MKKNYCSKDDTELAWQEQREFVENSKNALASQHCEVVHLLTTISARISRLQNERKEEQRNDKKEI